MPKCSYCFCTIDETEGNIVPGGAIMVAIQNGYEPDCSPSWGTMKLTAAKSIDDFEMQVTDQQLNLRWKRQLSQLSKRWRICDSCFSTLRPYLPANPHAKPGNYDNVSQQDKSLSWVVPVNTSIWAIFAGYAGLLSVIILPAPIALILGIVALIDLKMHPNLRGIGRAIFAIVMAIVCPILFAVFIAMLG